MSYFPGGMVSRALVVIVILFGFSQAFALSEKLPLECFKNFASDKPLAGEFSKVALRFNEDQTQVIAEFTKEDELKPSLFFRIPLEAFYAPKSARRGIFIPIGQNKYVVIKRVSFRMKKQSIDYHGILISSPNITMKDNDTLACDAEGLIPQ